MCCYRDATKDAPTDTRRLSAGYRSVMLLRLISEVNFAYVATVGGPEGVNLAECEAIVADE
ncbi:hypothetical protein GCM10027403_21410 [Arthrobacter tecti]